MSTRPSDIRRESDMLWLEDATDSELPATAKVQGVRSERRRERPLHWSLHLPKAPMLEKGWKHVGIKQMQKAKTKGYRCRGWVAAGQTKQTVLITAQTVCLCPLAGQTERARNNMIPGNPFLADASRFYKQCFRLTQANCINISYSKTLEIRS